MGRVLLKLFAAAAAMLGATPLAAQDISADRLAETV